MSAVYAPGAVAMIFTRGDDGLVVRLPDGDWLAVLSGERLNPYLQPHPLVVIDPENRAQVERLVVAHCRAYCCDPAPLQPEEVAIMQAALREFADPKSPKPVEPTGLGAVVEDTEGDFHVYSGVRDVADDQRWWVRGAFRRKYADIAAVRVLSEGVTQ